MKRPAKVCTRPAARGSTTPAAPASQQPSTVNRGSDELSKAWGTLSAGQLSPTRVARNAKELVSAPTVFENDMTQIFCFKDARVRAELEEAPNSRVSSLDLANELFQHMKPDKMANLLQFWADRKGKPIRLGELMAGSAAPAQ